MLSFSPSRRPGPIRRALGVLAVVVGGLVAAAAALGLLSPVVPPAGMWWWLQVFGVGLPLSMSAVALGAVVALAAQRWRWAGVFLGLLVAFGIHAKPWARGGAEAPSDADLVLMSFNVPRSGPSGEQLAQDIALLFQQSGADVLALQEATVMRGGDGQIYEPLQVGAKDSLGYTLLRPLLGLNAPTQVPVLVQPGFEALDLERVALPTAGDGFGRGSEAFRIQFRWRGKEGVLYNVHLRSFGAAKPWKEERGRLLDDTTWVGYANRYREAYQLRGVETSVLAARIESETLPVIVMGDFNSTPANWSFHRLAAARQDAQRVAGRRWWAPTYPAQRPAVRIDAVLADPAFVVTEAEVLPADFSDHRPVRVQLRWRD